MNLIPTSENKKKKGQLTLIGIFAIALVPMLLASYMYFNNVLVPSGRTNHGTLILPPLSLEEIGFYDASGKAISTQDLEEKWALFIVTEGDCAKPCQQAIYEARQVNVALHKDSDRVRRYFIAPDQEREQLTSLELAQRYPQMQTLTADSARISQMIEKTWAEQRETEHAYTLVVDPMGNIMMYYDRQNTGKQLLEDLKRLLKVSRIG